MILVLVTLKEQSKFDKNVSILNIQFYYLKRVGSNDLNIH